MDAAAESPLAAIRREVSKAVTGQADVVEQLLISMVCRESSQLEGPAGVGKWLTVQALARCLGLEARKIRGSGDLLPEALLGLVGEVARIDREPPHLPRGPLFAHVIFVDNLDHLSPRVYNLIQQAVQEHAVDFGGRRWILPDPFWLFAARRVPEEPAEPQLDMNADRFLFRVLVGYPPYDGEYAMAEATSSAGGGDVRQLLTAEEFSKLHHRALGALAPPPVIHYAVRLVRATRVHEGENPDFIYEWVQSGAGPRAVHGLVFASKARAVLHGRDEAHIADVQAVLLPVLRHRLVTNRNARSNGITPDRVIARLLDEIPPRVEGDETIPRPGQSLTFHDWTPLE